MQSITFQKANRSDAKEIQQLLKTIWQSTYQPFLSQTLIQKIIKNWHKIEKIKKQIKNNFFWIAKNKKSKIIGIINSNQEKNHINLHQLYIHPNYQNKGIGKNLFNIMEKNLSKNKKILIEVHPQNKSAIVFYKKLNFKQIKILDEELFGEKSAVMIMERSNSIPSHNSYENTASSF